MFYQQGDVIIERIGEMPENLKKAEGAVLEEGETPGHYHQLEGDQTALALYEDDAANKYFKTMAEMVLKHEEHNPIAIAPGMYRVRMVQEFDHLNRARRDVVD